MKKITFKALINILMILSTPNIQTTEAAPIPDTNQQNGPALNFLGKLTPGSRLLILVIAATVGICLNVARIGAFFLHPNNKRSGCGLLVLLALYDLVVAAAVLPISVAVILSGQEHDNNTCFIQYFLTQASTYSYSLTSLLVSMEFYYHLKARMSQKTSAFSHWISCAAGTLTFVLSFTACAIGTWGGLDMDYCTHKHDGNFVYQILISATFLWIPSVVSLIYHFLTYFRIGILSTSSSYRNSRLSNEDREYQWTNIGSHLFFIFSWLPYVIIINMYPHINSTTFYHLAVIGIARCVVASVVYLFMASYRIGISKVIRYVCKKQSFDEMEPPRRYRGRPRQVRDCRAHVCAERRDRNRMSRAGRVWAL